MSTNTWLGAQTQSGTLLGPMSLNLTIDGTSISGSGLLVIYFSMPGSWATPTLSATISGSSVSGTLAGVDPNGGTVAVTGTLNGSTLTLSGSVPVFGSASWTLTELQAATDQITGVWAASWDSGQSLNVALLQSSDSVSGVGTLTALFDNTSPTTINVVVGGTAKYPLFDLKVSTINPQMFSAKLTGTAVDANTLDGLLGLKAIPTAISLKRQGT